MDKSSTSTRSVYHVVPDGLDAKDGWDVKPVGSKAHGDHFDTKDEAVGFAKEKAKAADLGQIIVHKADGEFEYENTYGKDPIRHPG